MSRHEHRLRRRLRDPRFAFWYAVTQLRLAAFTALVWALVGLLELAKWLGRLVR